MLQQIKRIESALDCQKFCSYYYADQCTWWLYDEKNNYCKIFKGPQQDIFDDCFELGFSSFPSISECKTVGDPHSNDNCQVNILIYIYSLCTSQYLQVLRYKVVSLDFFQFFRQDYCRYEKDFLDNLEHSHDMDSCQWACQKNPMCNFFTFSKDKNVCMLHRVDIRKRVCDMIHGPPVPSLQSCLDDMEIPWALSSGEFEKF